MPRVPTNEVAETLAEQLVDRGFEGSLEWLTAWCRRWGTKVAQDTEEEPLFQHDKAEDPMKGPVVLLGPDRVPIQAYREWKALQDGTRQVIGSVTDDGAYARWAED